MHVVSVRASQGYESDTVNTTQRDERGLAFYGGDAGAATPLVVFIAGVAWLGLSGAPDERGFWPILLAGIVVGTALARDRSRYADAVLGGMGRRLVMVMVMAWILAGVLGTLVNAGGIIPELVGLATGAGIRGGMFVAAAFLICCLVSTATGTSLGTILVCGPLLYPAGGALGAAPPVLIGAILGGATFGDNISPVSDTTIASATTQQADLGGVVLSRLRYALPAATVALVLYGLVGAGGGTGGSDGAVAAGRRPAAWAIVLGPAATLGLLLARRHLVEGLLGGIVAAAIAGLAFGLFAPADLLSIDHEQFRAGGLILEGMERGVGVSVFTMLLMGLVGGVEASGLLDRLLARASRSVTSVAGAEWRIFASVSAAVLLTTHSVVAILTVGDFSRNTAAAFGLSRYRVANLLDTTVCTYPFLLPFFIPTILAASTTASGVNFGMPRVSALHAGLFNFHSWALLIVVVGAIATGFGRETAQRPLT